MQEEAKTRQIVFGILEFLSEEFNKPSTTADSKESLEVAMQCLETAFGINLQDVQCRTPKSLRELYSTSEGPESRTEAAPTTATATESLIRVDLGPSYDAPPPATEELQTIAEDFKNKGNEAMKNMNYSEALGHYNKAVELDGRNSVYFCNRAAAFIKLEQYDQALRDCQIAIRLQPNYARAYGRMGVTYSNQNKHVDAIMCYKKAVELEPNNESYQNNLRLSQSVLMQEIPGAQGGSPNLQTFFNNPSLINMASQMLQDPSMQQMMQNLMGGFQQSAEASGANPMDNLLQMGQAIASQIRQANPQLAEQLGVGGRTPGSGEGDGSDNGNSGSGNNFNPES